VHGLSERGGNIPPSSGSTGMSWKAGNECSEIEYETGRFPWRRGSTLALVGKG